MCQSRPGLDFDPRITITITIRMLGNHLIPKIPSTPFCQQLGHDITFAQQLDVELGLGLGVGFLGEWCFLRLELGLALVLDLVADVDLRDLGRDAIGHGADRFDGKGCSNHEDEIGSVAVLGEAVEVRGGWVTCEDYVGSHDPDCWVFLECRGGTCGWIKAVSMELGIVSDWSSGPGSERDCLVESELALPGAFCTGGYLAFADCGEDVLAWSAMAAGGASCCFE